MIKLGSTRSTSMEFKKLFLDGKFGEPGLTPSSSQVNLFYSLLAASHDINNDELREALRIVTQRYARGIGGQAIDLYDDLLDLIDVAHRAIHNAEEKGEDHV